MHLKTKTAYLTVIFTLIFHHITVAQNSVKLSGTVIGTAQSFDYDRNTCSTNVNTIHNAFDGNLQTIFASCQRTGGWVGLDLGSKHVITKVAYCPRSGQASRMLLGVFEGANQPDFGDAIPIYMIDETPTQNHLTNRDIVCSRGFRYVRYIGPNDVKCNLAEIEFYGYEDEGDDSQLFQLTNLPTVVIHTTNAVDVTSKDYYLQGIISTISKDGNKIYTDSLEIKGRGHGSWGHPKKPYRLKLYNKVRLLDMPAKEKSWVLVNNYGDKTLMRNLLAYDLSRRFEFNYTPAATPVDVFLNGEYKGNYQLCDKLEEGTNRVSLEKMTVDDVSLPNLTGGYMIEVSAYAKEETDWFESKRNHIPVEFKYPKTKNIVPQQKAYIKSHFDKMEAAIYAITDNNPQENYRAYVDTETFLKHFIIGEITGNTDTYWSTYMYKYREDDKFYFGPVWDFDIAYENDSRTYPINKKSNWIYNSSGSSAANGMRSLVNQLFKDPSLEVELKALYEKYRNSGDLSTEALLDVVDNYAEELNQSQNLNFLRWKILNTKVHQNPFALGSYEAEVNFVKDYIRDRMIWIDNKLNYIYSLYEDSPFDKTYIWSKSNTLYVEDLPDRSSINIYDVFGRMISSHSYAEPQFSINLKSGIYLVQITDLYGRSVTLKEMVR